MHHERGDHERSRVEQSGGRTDEAATPTAEWDGQAPIRTIHRSVGNQGAATLVQRQVAQIGSQTLGFVGPRLPGQSTGREAVQVITDDAEAAEAGQVRSLGTVYFPVGQDAVGDRADLVEEGVGQEILRTVQLYEDTPGSQTAQILVTGSASGEWEAAETASRKRELNMDLARRRAESVAEVLRSLLSARGIGSDAYEITIDARVGSRDPVDRSDRHAEVSMVAQTIPLWERPEPEPETEGPYDDHLLGIAVNNLAFLEAAESLVNAVAAALPGVAGTAGASRTVKVIEQVLKAKDLDEEFEDLSTTQKEKLREIKRETRLEYERLLELNPSYKPQYCEHYSHRSVCD